MSGIERISNRINTCPADVVLKLQRFVESSGNAGSAWFGVENAREYITDCLDCDQLLAAGRPTRYYPDSPSCLHGAAKHAASYRARGPADPPRARMADR